MFLAPLHFKDTFWFISGQTTFLLNHLSAGRGLIAFAPSPIIIINNKEEPARGRTWQDAITMHCSTLPSSLCHFEQRPSSSTAEKDLRRRRRRHKMFATSAEAAIESRKKCPRIISHCLSSRDMRSEAVNPSLYPTHTQIAGP